MILAIFGDIHGNLKDMYGLGERWQEQNARSIDLVLQTGDLGVWHDQSVLDRATARWVERDPTERACADYIAGRERAPIPTVFVAGNHEDFDFLAQHRHQPIDPFGMITFLDSGSTFKFQKGVETVRIAGLGGTHPQRVKPQNRARHLGRKYFSPEAVKRLMALGVAAVDILLTHEAPVGKGLLNDGTSRWGVFGAPLAVHDGRPIVRRLRRANDVPSPETGAEEITQLIQHLQPRYAFWGHYGYLRFRVPNGLNPG